MIVHQRVIERHPELTEVDVLEAWTNYTVGAVREPGEREVCKGFDLHGRELEMVGVLTEDGWLIYHAMTPPSKKLSLEIERLRRSQ